MKDERKLAARMTAEHLSALEQELDTARNCADPDWDQIEVLSREAAAMFVNEDDAEAGKQALLAALSAEKKPRIHTIRWGHFAAAAAIAGIAAISVPAALKQKNAIERIPEPVVSETTVTEVTGTTGSADPVTETKTTSSRKTTGTETTAVQTASTAEQADTETGTSSKTTETQITTASASAAKTEKTTAAKTESTRTTASQTESSVSVTSSETAESVTVTEPTDAPDTKPVQNTDIHTDRTQEWYYTDYTGYPGWPSYTTNYPSYTSTCMTEGYDHTDVDYTGTDMTATAPPEWTVFIYYFLDENTHEPVQGAQLQIYDITGNLILEFQTDDSFVTLNLNPGDSYRLHAVSVPEGYILPARDQIIKAETGVHEIYLRHE